MGRPGGKEHIIAPRFRFVDLFAGVGGFHQALADPNFGGECVLAVEWDEKCRRVYERAFPDTPLISDVRDITTVDGSTDRPIADVQQLVPDHDVLCAGFPCQPFSKSGAQMGVRDRTRGTLFFDILQIVRVKRPRFLILENVRNLAGPRHRDTWAVIISSLRQEGYRVSEEPVVFSPHLLPEHLGGRPQVRDRVFILAEHVGRGGALTSPPLVRREAVSGWSPDRWRIENFLEPDTKIPNLEEYRLRPEEEGWIEAWNHLVQALPAETLPAFPIWVGSFSLEPDIPNGTPRWKADFLRKNAAFYAENEDIIREWLRTPFGPLKQRVQEFPPSRRKFEWQARSFQPAAADRDLWKLVLHLRPSGVRVKPPTYLPALVAITQTSIIGSRRRRITPREAARLQGIDERVFAVVDDATAYRQLGNAVNVGAVQWVARALFESAGLDWGADRHGGQIIELPAEQQVLPEIAAAGSR